MTGMDDLGSAIVAMLEDGDKCMLEAFVVTGCYSIVDKDGDICHANFSIPSEDLPIYAQIGLLKYAELRLNVVVADLQHGSFGHATEDDD